MSRGRFQVLLALLRLTHAAAAPNHRHHGHSGPHLKNVTVRVRACDTPIKIANLGYLGPTKMNHLEYFSRAYAQPRYRSAAALSAGTYDLDYVPWNCLTELARATCPGGPALGSFSVLPFTVYGKKQPKVTHNSKIAALRETLCPGAKVDPGRFALLGTELPTRKVTSNLGLRGDLGPLPEFVGRHETFTITIPESVWSTGGTLAYLRKIPSPRILELQRGALRARARAMYTTAGDCRDANFAIASVLAERFRAHQAKKMG